MTLLKSPLLALIALAVAAPVSVAQSLTPVYDAKGQVYAYQEASACLLWPVPKAFPASQPISTLMRHDQVVHDPSKSGFFRLVPVAAPYAASMLINGRSGWRLPTVQEARFFFAAFNKPTTPAVLQEQTAVPGTYWTSDETVNQAAAVRPASPNPITQWYSRTGASAFVWPVLKLEPKECSGASINPFSG